MNKKYKCIESFKLPKCDENGGTTERFMNINKGSMWEVEETPYTLTGAELRLTSGTKWIELYEDHIDGYFEEIKEGENK